jgi:hypothetical protein
MLGRFGQGGRCGDGDQQGRRPDSLLEDIHASPQSTPAPSRLERS